MSYHKHIDPGVIYLFPRRNIICVWLVSLFSWVGFFGIIVIFQSSLLDTVVSVSDIHLVSFFWSAVWTLVLICHQNIDGCRARECSTTWPTYNANSVYRFGPAMLTHFIWHEYVNRKRWRSALRWRIIGVQWKMSNVGGGREKHAAKTRTWIRMPSGVRKFAAALSINMMRKTHTHTQHYRTQHNCVVLLSAGNDWKP